MKAGDSIAISKTDNIETTQEKLKIQAIFEKMETMDEIKKTIKKDYPKASPDQIEFIKYILGGVK